MICSGIGVADLKYELAFLAKRNNDTLRLCAPVASSRETRPRHWQAESVKQKNHYSYFDSATPRNLKKTQGQFVAPV
jgi:hypothetical protein